MVEQNVFVFEFNLVWLHIQCLFTTILHKTLQEKINEELQFKV